MHRTLTPLRSLGLKRRPISSIRTLSSRAIVFASTGNPYNVLSLHSYSLPDDPAPNSVLVKFLAAPINPADLNQIEGVYASKAKFQTLPGKEGDWAVGGNEGVVKILKVGDQVKAEGIKPGQWAIMKSTAFGTWRTHAETTADSLLPLPEKTKISPLSAATISVNPFTADRMLLDFVNLEPGDWVVQNGANSGVGQNVIQLARLRGLKTVNIIRDRPNFEEVKKSLEELGADMVLKDTDLTNRDIVRSITSRHAIRLALNCVGGKTTSNMMKLLGQNAVIVTYGAMAREPLMIPATPLIFKGLTAKGFWVSNWQQSHPEERKKELAWLCERIEKGELKDVENEKVRWGGEGVSEETAWERVQAALAKIRDGQSGKKMILVNYDPEDVKHLHSH